MVGAHTRLSFRENLSQNRRQRCQHYSMSFYDMFSLVRILLTETYVNQRVLFSQVSEVFQEELRVWIVGNVSRRSRHRVFNLSAIVVVILWVFQWKCTGSGGDSTCSGGNARRWSVGVVSSFCLGRVPADLGFGETLHPEGTVGVVCLDRMGFFHKFAFQVIIFRLCFRRFSFVSEVILGLLGSDCWGI